MGTIHRHTRKHYNQKFAELELGSGGHIFILKLYEKDGMTQNEITELLHFDKAHTARTLSKLIELGYVTKKHDEKDKRAFRIFLTKKGKKIIPHLKKAIKDWNRILTSDFTKEEKDILFNLLSRMAEKAVRVVKS